VAVTVPGYSRAGAAGEPLLPLSPHLVALPPGAVVRVRVLRLDQTRQALSAPLERVPWPEEAPVDPDAMVEGAQSSEPAPQEAVVFEELGSLRGVRLARLVFYPAILDDGALLVTQRLRVSLSWDAPVRPAQGGSDALLDQLRGAVLNPADVLPAPRPVSQDATALPEAAAGAVADDGADATADAVGVAAATATALLELSEPGIYQVGYEDLNGLGFAAANPNALRLLRGGQEVAYQWLGDSDLDFEATESLIFYAEPRFSRWTAVDVYRLEVDTVLGKRMTARSADPSGLPDGTAYVEQLFEENETYMPDSLRGHLPTGRDGDRWVWRQLVRPGDDSTSVSFDLTAVKTTAAAEVTLWFNGYTFDAPDPDHRVRVTVNGQLLGTVQWEGATAHEVTLSIPAGVLQTNNTLSLRLPGISGVSQEGCWLDAFSVRYARSSAEIGTGLIFEGAVVRQAYSVGLGDALGLRAYDVTDPLQPQLLTDVQTSGNTVEIGDPTGGRPRRYAIAGASGLRAPDRIRGKDDVWRFNLGGEPDGADMLVITHPDFESALDPLVAQRQAQGLSVAVANVLGIYDVWGDGRHDPQAIRAFIADAYDSWDPQPTYVLLVGDGSFDPRQYLPGSPETFIPPYLADVDPWAGEAAADNRYVCVDGGDALPDMLLGRLPVETLQEAEAMVSKGAAYEVEPGLRRWNRRVVLAADDADGGGDFPALADSHAGDRVPGSYRLTRYYCTEGSPLVSDCPPARAQQIHDSLLGAWNNGALLIGFVGHASWQQWAVPVYLHLDDLPSFDNQARAPVVVGMTCFTSAFQRPEPTLDEGLVTRAQGGAVATWGGTGLGLTTGHGLLSEGFFDAVLVDEVATVGEAELAGKLYLAPAPYSQELLDTFVVLGDPALMLNREAAPAEVFLPLMARGYTPGAGKIFLPLVMRGG
jgi:hypothetical protein